MVTLNGFAIFIQFLSIGRTRHELIKKKKQEKERNYIKALNYRYSISFPPLGPIFHLFPFQFLGLLVIFL